MVGPRCHFEEAEAANDESERKAWQTFVVVGGGPTGVKVAGAIAELARYGMSGDFRSVDPSTSRVILVQSAAVADFGRIRIKGATAWWLWGLVHVLFLIDGRSRAGVVFEWLWDYLTLRRGTRLITGNQPEPEP